MNKAEETQLFKCMEEILAFQRTQLKHLELIHDRIIAIGNFLSEDRKIQTFDMRGRKPMPRKHPFVP